MSPHLYPHFISLKAPTCLSRASGAIVLSPPHLSKIHCVKKGGDPPTSQEEEKKDESPFSSRRLSYLHESSLSYLSRSKKGRPVRRRRKRWNVSESPREKTFSSSSSLFPNPVHLAFAEQAVGAEGRRDHHEPEPRPPEDRPQALRVVHLPGRQRHRQGLQPGGLPRRQM